MVSPECMLLAAVPELGGYFSVPKIVVMLVLLVPWLQACAWASKDITRVHTQRLVWLPLVMGSGVLAVVLWLAAPWFMFGLAAYLVLVGGAITAYVVHRNKRVVPKAKVFTAAHLRTLLHRQKEQKVEIVQKLKLYDSLTRPVFPPAENEPELRQIYNLVQTFLHNVITYRASEVEIIPSGPQSAVRFAIDGVIQPQPAMDHIEAETLIDYLKTLAGLNVEDKRRPQMGKVNIEMGAVATDMTVSTAGTTHGQRLGLRVVLEAVRTDIGQLGMPEDLRDRLEHLNAQSKGMTIVSSLHSNGATSTLYSLLRLHDAFTKQLVTLEANPKIELENVAQQKYADQNELLAKLASVLRRDPEIIMVDNCQSPQAAALLRETAETKNVLLGLSADSTFVALAKWVKLNSDHVAPALGCLKTVVCQVLVRKLCPGCKEEYRPARDMLAKLNLPAEKIDKFYRPPTKPLTDEKGNPITCATCRGTGYYGRTAAFELLELSDEIRQLVAEGASLNRIKAACRKNRMLYLQEQALRKVIEGVTSIEEVVRVSKPAK